MSISVDPSDQLGFTLIELLVVILVVGVLAAIAIPAFSDTSHAASDAQAKELAHTAQITTETVASDDSGSYATLSRKLLKSYEPTIATAQTEADAYLSAASGTDTSYKLTVASVATGDKFTIEREPDGTISRTCTISSKTSPHGGCREVKGTKGSW